VEHVPAVGAGLPVGRIDLQRLSGNQAVLNGQSTSGGWTSATYYNDEMMKQELRVDG